MLSENEATELGSPSSPPPTPSVESAPAPPPAPEPSYAPQKLPMGNLSETNGAKADETTSEMDKSNKVEWTNPSTSETDVHRDRPDGKSDLFTDTELDKEGGKHGHTVFDENGAIEYHREPSPSIDPREELKEAKRDQMAEEMRDGSYEEDLQDESDDE